MEFVLGGGCFWCLEAVFQEIVGVTSVVNGYAGGTDPHPTYERIHSSRTGHAEVVKVNFDASVIPPEIVLDLYFISHDPTTLNRQGNDVGPEYRSVMLYADEAQKQQFVAAKKRAQKVWADPIVTEIVPLEAFYKAEEEHQSYYKNHPEQAYCKVVIAPKLHHVRQKYTKWFAVNTA